ncbi:tyrosine-type recombinase/integrase [Flagellimonas onchidii]|uniref:tyrosine-type recombinase/integrase n=1 Tax=Flagellimonas onchidii TaxID=2562684 RepID=UPI0014562003|nr:tyrosine-type recombinase/integrase [Allomuricauda onchidii]
MKKLELKNPHFIKAHQEFAQRKKDEGKSHAHITSVANLSKEFLHYLEQNNIVGLATVTRQNIDEYFDYLTHRPNQRRLGTLSSAYINKHREAVLRFMEFVHGVDVGQSPFYIPKQKTDAIPKDILTVDEVQELFKAQDNTINGIRNKAILGILYGCGLRKGELYRLDVLDIDFNKNTLRVKQSKTFTQRDVPIGPAVRKYLEDYLYGVREILAPDHEQQTAFLLNNSGQRMSLHGIQYKIKEISKVSKTQKPITAHRLRHAIATHLTDDFTIEEIAQFLGHSCIDSSQIYTHIKYTELP